MSFKITLELLNVEITAHISAEPCIKHGIHGQELHFVGRPKNLPVNKMKLFNYKYYKIKQTIHHTKLLAPLILLSGPK